MAENSESAEQISRYQHGSIMPTSDEWNLKIQADFIQTNCIEICKAHAEYGVTCSTFAAMITAQDAHRTHFPMDGPLYVDKTTGTGEMRCSLLEGLCKIQTKPSN